MAVVCNAHAQFVPWSIQVGGDLRLPEVAAPRPPMVRLLNWYIGNV